MSRSIKVFAVIYHPLKFDLDKLKVAVSKHTDLSSWDNILWLETSNDCSAADCAKLAVDSGVSLIIACGGDGTVREVGSVLVGTDIALGIVAGGTGNLLARNLKLHINNVNSCLRDIFSGRFRFVDAIRVSGFVFVGDNKFVTKLDTHFFVLGGAGVDAAMIEGTDPVKKKRFGWAAYLEGITKSLIDLEPFEVAVETSTPPPLTLNAYSFMVGNCGMLQGNFSLLPDAKFDDGLLDVFGLCFSKKFALVKFGSDAALNSTRLGRSAMQKMGSDRAIFIRQDILAKVSLPVPVPFQLDGDVVGLLSSASFDVVPGGLKVVGGRVRGRLWDRF